MTCAGVKFDQIGHWSEIKLDIVKDYAAAYAMILSKQSNLAFAYIDGFSGAGEHIRKDCGTPVPGSPLNALNVEPPFDQYFLIDLDGEKVGHLRRLVGDRGNVHIFEGDCNDILVNEVIPQVQYRQFRRGLCLLDPYGLHLNWEVMAAAGASRAIDLFLNFPVMDINMNVLRHRQDKVSPNDAARMTSFWGDGSWRDIAYEPSPQGNLFGEDPDQLKVSNEVVAEAFRKRLNDVAGFAYVPEPMPMRIKNRAIVYYLFFASQKEVGGKVYRAIKRKYETRGM